MPWRALNVDSNSSANRCGDPRCVVCLHSDCLISTFGDLPEWMFVLSETRGNDCTILVYDPDGKQQLIAKGSDMEAMLHDLRADALRLHDIFRHLPKRDFSESRGCPIRRAFCERVNGKDENWIYF